MKRLAYFSLLVGLISCGSEPTPEAEVEETTQQVLPYFGQKDVEMIEVDGEMVADTIYHVVPEYIFTDQDSNLFTNENVSGKIHVANFFFTSCPAICPAMIEQMRRLQGNTTDIEELSFLSHTIDPKRDTIPKLQAYIAERELNTENWSFLYDSDRDYIHDIAKTGYIINAMEDEEADGGFLHSEHFILVDREGHIRGLYEGTDPSKVDLLEADIRKLIKEQYGE
ncbi:MAG: SCO family protein [Crocinitomicaceae bacterium]|nr:SCO family protein [Crocinitomicaceae bacterium]